MSFTFSRSRPPREPATLHPPKIREQAEKLLNDFLAELRPSGLAGDAKVFTQQQWIDRNEKYGTHGAAILSLDGSWLYEVFNCYDMGKCAQKWQARFYEMLNEHGFWYEIGEAWFLYIYKEN